MRYFEHNGTIYRITLCPGDDWRDSSKDVLHRWVESTRTWEDSVMSVNHIRSFGEQLTDYGVKKYQLS